jgi:hypothetical protein
VPSAFVVGAFHCSGSEPALALTALLTTPGRASTAINSSDRNFDTVDP